MSGGHPRIRAVLFDLGGTLVDVSDFAGWVEMARTVGLDLVPDELAHAVSEVESAVDAAPLAEGPDISFGEPMIEFWRRVLSRAHGEPVTTETAARFVALRAPNEDHPIALYSDVRRCLDQLRNERRRLGIVSNSTSQARVRHLLDRVGILDYFEQIVSSGTERVAKPDPEIFRRALARLRLDPSESLYVGNLRSTDALAALRAGLHAVWLHRDGTGFGDDPPEIISLLEVPLVVHSLEGMSPRGAQPSLK